MFIIDNPEIVPVLTFWKCLGRPTIFLTSNHFSLQSGSLVEVALVGPTDMKSPMKASMPKAPSSLNMLSVSSMVAKVLVVTLFSGPIVEAIQV